MRELLLVWILSVLSMSVSAKTLTPDMTRTIYIRGAIGNNGFSIAQKIEQLSQSEGAITLIINSPGGAIIPGLQVISAMKVAKARGDKIVCIIPVVAASMAFQIFINCDERYTLTGTMLLFHPATTGGDRLNQDDLLYAGSRLRAIEEPLVKDLFRILKMPRDVFVYHYRHQTLWVAPELKSLCPDLFTIVDDIKATGLFTLGE